MKKFVLILFLLNTSSVKLAAQITNYVSNGSFESLNSNSVASLYNVVNYWQPIDTNQYCDYLATLAPPFSNAPGAGGQYPRSGKSYVIVSFFGVRGYPRNRLKQKLKPNATYCVTFHIVNTNNNPYAVDGFGAYFANETLDTITQCNVALSYLSPQIKNPEGNIITDTLNWIPITGTFVANGTEKYMVLGNFKTDAATNTLLINPTYSATITADICIDDVSCIELHLPAFAGRDTVAFAGDSIFLGREHDVGIDEACIWYKLPGTAPIDTVAGFWIKPTETCTYIVRQEICGLVKWDTVVIYMDAVGIEKLKIKNDKLKIYPVPARDVLNFEFEHFDEQKNILVSLTDKLGQIILQQDLHFEQNKAILNTASFQPGVYVLQLRFPEGIISRKVVISAE